VRIEQLTASEISHSSKILKVHGQCGQKRVTLPPQWGKGAVCKRYT